MIAYTTQRDTIWTSEYDDWKADWDTPRDAFKQRIIDDARDLLVGPWPPAE